MSVSFPILASGIQLPWQYPTGLLAGPVQTAAKACQPIGILLISPFQSWQILTVSGGAGINRVAICR